MRRKIYLDNSATTPVKKEVIAAMRPYWNTKFGNPGSITKIGTEARSAVEKARKIIADFLVRRSNEIIFTSGGTESNNLAILGTINNLLKRGFKICDLHLITSNIEHSSISEVIKELERQGAGVSYLEVDSSGLIRAKDLRKIVKPNTVLISIGYANNEIGVIQPIKDLAREIRHAKKNSSIQIGEYPYFHTDASQAGLYCNLNVNELGVDLLTLDGQKIGGPKGVGALFIKSTANLAPILFGGGQERGLRPGTENVPLIVGLSKAISLIEKERNIKIKKIENQRNYFWQKIKKEIPGVVLNGEMGFRLPNNLNISIPGLDSEFTVLCLDEEGIICSTRSACNHDEDGSVVVRALLNKSNESEKNEIIRSTLRFSLGEEIDKKSINYVVSKLKELVTKQIKNNYSKISEK